MGHPDQDLGRIAVGVGRTAESALGQLVVPYKFITDAPLTIGTALYAAVWRRLYKNCPTDDEMNELVRRIEKLEAVVRQRKAEQMARSPLDAAKDAFRKSIPHS